MSIKMQFITKAKLLALALSILGGVSCNKSNTTYKFDNHIQFSNLKVQTKGKVLESNTLNSMGVFAYRTGTNDFIYTGSFTPDYLYNQKVERTDYSVPWAYLPKVLWPTDKISFFAYAPYGTAVTSANTKTGAPTLDFTVDEDAFKHVDFLLAEPLLNEQRANGGGSDPVSLSFNHTLTKIQVSAKVNSSELEARGFKITKIGFENVATNGVASWDNTGEPTWNINPASLSNVYAQGEALNDIILKSAKYQSINSNSGLFFMLPQIINPSATEVVRMVVHMQESTKDDSDPTKNWILTQNIVAPINTQGEQYWGTAEAIDYKINYTGNAVNPFEISYRIVDWESIGVDGSVGGSYLNVSESNITIDPGEGCSLFYSTDYVGVVTATYTGPGGVSGALTKSGNSFIVPNTFSRGVYNVTITAGEVSRVVNINVGGGMFFTINTTKNTSNTADATFIVPLAATTISGYDLTIDWGDGASNNYPSGTTLDQTNLTHTYSTAGEYVISISSSQKDKTKAQMPAFSFYNYGSVNNNRQKLISMDSPMLNTATTSFVRIFINCANLTTLAADLFDYNKQVVDFKDAFYGCNNLASIPEGLFDNNTEATIFQGTFYGCSEITSIPTALFAKNTKVTTFNQTFTSCTNLESIPAALFTNNTEATIFQGTFYGCSKITSIPTALFAKNIKVTNFNQTFSSCTNLESIPAALFTNNTAVINFYATFSDCVNLKSIPVGLFANNIAATSFNQTFYNCYKATLNPNIFCNEATEYTTRFAGKTVIFNYCFRLNNTFTGTKGTAPQLWNYTASSKTGTTCFTRHSTNSLTNYSSIPASWL